MLEHVGDLLIAPPNLGDFNPRSVLTPGGCPIEWTFSSRPSDVRYMLDIHPRQVPEALKPLVGGLPYCWLNVQRTPQQSTYQLIKPHGWTDPDPLFMEDCVPVLAGFSGPKQATEVHYLYHPGTQGLEKLLEQQHPEWLPAFWNDLRFLTRQPHRRLPHRTPITLIVRDHEVSVHIPSSALFLDERIARQRLGQWFSSEAYTAAMQHTGLIHTTVGWEFSRTGLVRTVGVTLRTWR